MSEPIQLDAGHFFEFVGVAEPTVVFLSLHPVHGFNRALARRFAGDDAMPLGVMAMTDLLVAESAVLPFLHHGLADCGVASPLAVLPGYYLFREGRLLAWDSGLPTTADTSTILRCSLLGAVAFVFTRDLGMLGKAVRLGAEEAAAERLSMRFRSRCDGSAQSRYQPPPAADDVAWAYATLGVHATATDAEVNAAWRRLGRESHPDLVDGDPTEAARRGRRLAEIHRAREIIRNHRSRRAN